MSEPSRYLTQYGLMAEKHWREFRPKMVRDLEVLWEAEETMIDEMELLTRKLETEQKLTPQQAHDQAWEMIRAGERRRHCVAFRFAWFATFAVTSSRFSV